MTDDTGLSEIWRESVRSEWCDFNNHLNLAYYILIFDHATDVFHNSLGLNETYRTETGCSTFAVESHALYLAEVHQGDEVFVTTQLLDHDEKRLHYFHRMYHAEKGFLSATNELMTVHIDMGIRKVAPMPAGIRDKATALYGEHRNLPVPDQRCAAMGIRRK
tara:strand:- start:2287 stop:2772 length:486 start_codon:yes stop_codon:yes gene_type:complete